MAAFLIANLQQYELAFIRGQYFVLPVTVKLQAIHISLTAVRKGQPLFSFRKGQLRPLAKRGHPAATALALMGQPAPLASKGHPLFFLKKGQPESSEILG